MGVANDSVESNGQFKSIKVGFVERWYLRYTLWTGIYMLDAKEAAIANAVFAGIFFYSCRCSYYAVNALVSYLS